MIDGIPGANLGLKFLELRPHQHAIAPHQPRLPMISHESCEPDLHRYMYSVERKRVSIKFPVLDFSLAIPTLLAATHNPCIRHNSRYIMADAKIQSVVDQSRCNKNVC